MPESEDVILVSNQAMLDRDVVLQYHQQDVGYLGPLPALIDRGKRLNVSREHFQIEKKRDGTYELVDRGSACGTIVGGHVVGGRDKEGRCPLKGGDVIVVGTSKSLLVFRFLLSSE